MAYKGKYKPTNPQKYVGDATKIVYRSLWERRCMKMFDSNKNIIKWASEEVAIPYRSPKDNRIHKYYPDFIVEQKNKRGEVEIVMIEVKFVCAMFTRAPSLSPSLQFNGFIHQPSAINV